METYAVNRMLGGFGKRFVPMVASLFPVQREGIRGSSGNTATALHYIAMTLHRFLPQNYRQTLAILLPVSERFSGFEYMFFPDFAEIYGLDDFMASMSALETFIAYSSSEFAVRAFILRYPDKTMQQMRLWARSDCLHVRRLASEGCRPRLPWAKSLAAFKKNPEPVLDILEKLKADKSAYVRRSVANNLNDISKDNPQTLITVAERWLGVDRHTDWIVKHACRTLLKQGNPRILALFGLAAPEHIGVQDFTTDPVVPMGKSLMFSFRLFARKGNPGRLRIEYGIDFLRSNGRHNRKIFKLAEKDYPDIAKAFTKTHSFQPITTRVYYPGRHYLAIIINGVEMQKKAFLLTAVFR